MDLWHWDLSLDLLLLHDLNAFHGLDLWHWDLSLDLLLLHDLNLAHHFLHLNLRHLNHTFHILDLGHFNHPFHILDDGCCLDSLHNWSSLNCCGHGCSSHCGGRDTVAGSDGWSISAVPNCAGAEHD